MGYTALYREWRPQQFSDIVGQEHITRTLQNAIKTGRIAHAYLFCGPRGTGKTTTAKVLAKAVNCVGGPEVEPCNQCDNCRRVTEGNSLDVLEIDAASNRGIDEIRDLREKVKFAPTEGRFRIYIIDEVHMLTTEAFNALLKTLEEPPAHVIFVLATTEPHKIPLTILSRCQRFDFRRIGMTDIIVRLREVVSELGIEADNEALGLIARTSEGGMRDALSVLDQCIAFGGQEVTVEDIHTVLGTVNSEFIFRLTGLLADRDNIGALRLVDELVRQGKDVRQFTKDLTEQLRNLLLIEVCSNVEELVPVTAEVLQQMQGLAHGLGKKKIMALIELFTSTEREMRWTSQPRLILELAVIKAGDTAVGNLNDLAERVAKIEAMVSGGQVVMGGSAAASRKVPQQTNSPASKSQLTKPAGSVKPKDFGSAPGYEETSGYGTAWQSVDAETVKKCWPEILDRVKQVRRTAQAFLVESRVVAVDQGAVILQFAPEYGFHKEKIEQPDNRNAIESVLKEVIGADLKIKCRFPDDTGQETSATKLKDEDGDLFASARAVFGEEVIEIKD